MDQGCGAREALGTHCDPVNRSEMLKRALAHKSPWSFVVIGGGFSIRVTAVRDHQFLQSTRSVEVPWDDKEVRVSFETFRDGTLAVRSGYGIEPSAGRALGTQLDALGEHAP